MTSSMLTGDRRWGSTRRGGMTVLGKVAVPKPINLPSQRLENHGLDRSVEIVPKGTLSWGSRPSSSASNAWNSSALSPTTDGGSGSPSRLSGRPSSGGSGTRPSTAGSDRGHEPTSSAWGSSSRPSSASGSLTSTQTLVTSLRPRSADTRPGSSQLSRFAEPSSENSGAWGASRIAEKLGVSPSKIDGFSLSSGDFPTLGSEKDNSLKNTDSQEHGRPGSSSSGSPLGKERRGAIATGDVSEIADVRSRNANTWRRDYPPHGEDGFHPNMEKWQGEPQPYQNANMPPQHFAPWHGAPAPAGVWYRGPPAGPPYGPPVAPGGFPMEYPYYRPQLPATALASSQPVPPPGAGPRGPHPNAGDMYRPHIPDAYIRPGIPMRPGFYPGPVAYEGYYGPPMGFCNTNEREIPFMGMAAGPSVHDRYTGQNASDSSKSQAGSGGYGSTGKTMVSEQMESGHPQDPRGQYKVLLTQPNGWDGKVEEQKWQHAAPTDASHLEKVDQPRTTSREDDVLSDYRKDDQMGSRRMAVAEGLSQTSYNQEGASVPGKVKLSESVGNVNAVDDNWERKLDDDVSGSSSATPKDATLIQKIENLNAKVRVSGGQHDVAYVSSRDEQKNKFHSVNPKVIHSTNDGSTGAVCYERTYSSGISSPMSVDMGFSTRDKGLESADICEIGIPRKAIPSVQRRADHRKGKFNTPESDGWQKKSNAVDSPSVVTALSCESPNVYLQDRNMSVDVPGKLGACVEKKDDGESVASVSDPSDFEAQRAKMRELAKQRAKQLQKEEEERIREQKAKALAKLEELNRRTQAMEGLTPKFENPPVSAAVANHTEAEPQVAIESNIGTDKVGSPNSAVVFGTIVAAHSSLSSTGRVREPDVLSRDPPLETQKNTIRDSVATHNQSLPLQQDLFIADVANIASDYPDSSVTKQKRTGYKHKQKIPGERSPIETLSEKSTSITNEAPKNQATLSVSPSAEVVESVLPVNSSVTESSLPVNSSVTESSLPINSNTTNEPSAHQRRKNGRGGRNRHKQEEASTVAVIPSMAPKETNTAKVSVESSKPKSPALDQEPKPVPQLTSSEAAVQSSDQHSSMVPKEANISKVSVESSKPKSPTLELEPKPVQQLTSSEAAVQSLDQHSSLASEDSHARLNNHWKPQNPRRLPRNQQANRAVDKFHGGDTVIWAPVRLQNKSEVNDELSHKTVHEEAVSPTTKNDQPVQNNLKNKRHEMERYVPKPVAKELAQQGCIQQPIPPSSNQITSAESVGRAEFGSQSTGSDQPPLSVTGKVGFSVEGRNGDSKQNKQAKAHGSWRERGSTESTHVKVSQDGSSFYSNPSKDVKEAIEHNQSMKLDEQSVKVQPKVYDDWGDSDGWNIPNSSDSAAPIPVPVVKDQGFAGRGKRHPYKGHRVLGNNNNELDRKNGNRGEMDKVYLQSSVLETSEADKTVALKDNRGYGERPTSHWQPKAQGHSAHSQRGNHPSGSQNVAAEVGRFVKKESPSQGGVHPNDNETREAINQSQLEHSILGKIHVSDVPNIGHQDVKREKKVASVKGRPDSPQQGSGSLLESAPNEGVDHLHEQQIFSSGFRKNVSQNNRFSRGPESRKDWSSAGQDIKQHNQPANRERQRHNAHYEYQPIGPYNNDKPNAFEGQTEGPSRYRPKGLSHSKRGGGNFYGRQGSGAKHMVSGQDDVGR